MDTIANALGVVDDHQGPDKGTVHHAVISISRGKVAHGILSKSVNHIQEESCSLTFQMLSSRAYYLPYACAFMGKTYMSRSWTGGLTGFFVRRFLRPTRFLLFYHCLAVACEQGCRYSEEIFVLSLHHQPPLRYAINDCQDIRASDYG